MAGWVCGRPKGAPGGLVAACGVSDFHAPIRFVQVLGLQLFFPNCSEKALHSHNRDNPIFKLWHLNGSLESLSKDQLLFTFYELDQPTKQEINIIVYLSLAL